MRVLIIGGNSNLGRSLIKVLSEFCEVVTAGRGNCDINFDLSDSVQNIIFPKNIDVLVHAAAHFGGESGKDMIDAEIVNVVGTIKMCELAAQANVKHFILISSIFVLLKKNDINYSVYSLSKKQSEEIADLYCSSMPLPLTILRPSQIYGIIDNFNHRQPFLNLILDKAQSGDTVHIFGSRDAKINIIHINDLVKIIALVVEYRITGTYACMHPSDISYVQFAKTAFRYFDKEEKICFLKDERDISDNIFSKDDSLYKKIGYYPQISLEEGIGAIVRNRKGI
jgi:nucleoside-diphosphate-sugar epimerase